MKKVLFVCVGNICRSPLAEALLNAWCLERDLPAAAESAGIAAVVNAPADKSVRQLLEKRRIDISNHRARQITAAMAKHADVILTMEKKHQRHIEMLYPYVRGRTFLIGHWNDNAEVSDPYGRPIAAFEEALAVIDQGLNKWQAFLYKQLN